MDQSVLKGIPVDDREWKFKRSPMHQALEVVGACPSCGCPIYGHKKLLPDEPTVVRKSCVCPSAAGASFGPLPNCGAK